MATSMLGQKQADDQAAAAAKAAKGQNAQLQKEIDHRSPPPKKEQVIGPGAPIYSDAAGMDFDGSQGVDNIPGTFEVWSVGGQLMLVWMQPTLSGEEVPLAYSVTAEQIRLHWGGSISSNPVETFNDASFASLGGLFVGSFVELNNPDSHPFDTWLNEMVEQAGVYPWLLDPEIMSVTAAAWLEGRSATLAELASTSWWQEHSQAERDWMVFSHSDPEGAADRMQDNRITILDMLNEAGINNPPGALVDLIADHFTTGLWTQVYAQNQVDLLADPQKQGDLDDLLTGYATDGGLDTTNSRRDDVRAMVRRWLGPMHGNWDDAQIDQWAGRLRNDPEGASALTEMLARHRLALFPEYEDGSLTYEDIAGPWRGLVNQSWGQEPDETDGFFNNIIRTNDSFTASKMLREEGLKRQIGKVGTDATADLMESFGGNVIRVQ